MVLPAQSPSLGATAGATTLDITNWASRFEHLHIDLGTGDGRFAVHLARARPELGVIGIDTCLDHLHGSPRRFPANVRFVQSDARDAGIGAGVATRSVSINFPYGSLLRGLVDADPALLDRLDELLGPRGHLQVRVNERALHDELPGALPGALLGTALDPHDAGNTIVRGLRRLDRVRVSSRPIERAELRAFPSTWSKRIGFGRPSAALLIEASRRSG